MNESTTESQEPKRETERAKNAPQSAQPSLADNPAYFYYKIQNRKSRRRAIAVLLVCILPVSLLGLYYVWTHTGRDESVLIMIWGVSCLIIYQAISPQGGKAFANKLLEPMDDWWLTGVGGKTLTPVFASIMTGICWKTSCVFGPVFAIGACAVLMIPQSTPMIAGQAPFLAWAAGVCLALSRTREVDGLTSGANQLCDYVVRERLRVRGGQSEGESGGTLRHAQNYGRAKLRAGLRFLLLYFCMILFALGGIAFGDYVKKTQLTSSWIAGYAFSLLVVGWLSGALYSQSARRRAPENMRRIAKAFDDLMEIRRVLRHELGGPSPVGGPKR